MAWSPLNLTNIAAFYRADTGVIGAMRPSGREPIMCIEYVRVDPKSLVASLAELDYSISPMGMNLLAFPKDAPYVKLIDEERKCHSSMLQ